MSKEITKELKKRFQGWANWKGEHVMPNADFYTWELGMEAEQLAIGEHFGFHRAIGILQELSEGATVLDYHMALVTEFSSVMLAYSLHQAHGDSNWMTQMQLKGKCDALMEMINFVQSIEEN